MYEQIASNVNKTRLLFGLFIAVVVLIGYAFGQVSGGGYGGVALAAIIAIVGSLGAYYASDRLVLAMSRARPATKEEFPYLANTVEGLSIAAGIPVPKAYVIDDTAPNAFATGRDPEHSVVVVTTGLLSKLDRQELEGVVAHEMSHIKNYDVRLATVAVVLVGTVALLSDWMLRSMWWRGTFGPIAGRRRGGRWGREGGQNPAGAILLIIGILLGIFGPLIAQLLRFAMSRRREFLADADAALLTRYPDGLAQALEKIAADPEPLEAANKATAHLYIINPFKGGSMANLWSTHPPVEERVKRLRAM